MIINGKSTPIDGSIICGKTFYPADGDSSHAVFFRDGRCCGITYEMGRVRPFLRCSPGFMLPLGARDADAWLRAAWDADDDRMLDFEVDPRDGEVTYIYHSNHLSDEPERCIEECLDFLLGDELHEFVVCHIKNQLGIDTAD